MSKLKSIPPFTAKMKLSGTQLICSLTRNSTLKRKFVEIILFNNDKEIQRQTIETTNETLILNFMLPLKLFNGCNHLFILEVSGYQEKLAAEFIYVPFHLTPWSFFKKGGLTGENFYSLSTFAHYRYSSLAYHLEQAHKYTRDALQNIMRAHHLVCDGFEERTGVPQLSFPKYNQPEVSIIIGAFNNFNITCHTLASIILSPSTQKYEVLLVDDASTDDVRKIETFFKNITVIRNKKNLGFLKSYNKGARHAKGKWLVFLNNDVELAPFWLDELIKAFSLFPDAGLVGSKLLNEDGTLQDGGGMIWPDGSPWLAGRGANPKDPRFNYTRSVDYVSGASICIPRFSWEKLKGFDEQFSPAYYEDTDLATRIRQSGKKVYYVGTSEVIHFEGMSHGKDLSSGIKRYQKINEKKFKRKWRNSFFTNGARDLPYNILLDRDATKRVLMVDYDTPRPDNDAGGYAAFQEIQILKSLGYKITFLSGYLAFRGKYTTELQRNGVEVLFAPFAKSLSSLVQERGHEFDIFYITRFYLAEKLLNNIRTVNPKAKVILNIADLHFLRMLRAQTLGLTTLKSALKIQKREVKTLKQVDAILSYSEHEKAVIFSHIHTEDKLFTCPWVLEDKFTQNEFEDRHEIAFLGFYDHAPNVDAVRYFVQEVMPLLRKQKTKICLHLYGSGSLNKLREFEGDDVLIKGYVPVLADMFSSIKLFVAPLQFGAGVKGKVLEAIAHGVPTVISPIAAEGLQLISGVNTMECNTPQEWVTAINQLYFDKLKWSTIRKNSREVISRYSQELGREKIKKIFDYLGSK